MSGLLIRWENNSGIRHILSSLTQTETYQCMWPVFFFLLWFAMPSRCRPDKLPDVINIANDNSFVSRVCSWGAVVLRGRDAAQIEARRKLPFALPLFSLCDCCHSHTRDGGEGRKAPTLFLRQRSLVLALAILAVFPSATSDTTVSLPLYFPLLTHPPPHRHSLPPSPLILVSFIMKSTQFR